MRQDKKIPLLVSRATRPRSRYSIGRCPKSDHRERPCNKNKLRKKENTFIFIDIYLRQVYSLSTQPPPSFRCKNLSAAPKTLQTQQKTFSLIHKKIMPLII